MKLISTAVRTSNPTALLSLGIAYFSLEVIIVYSVGIQFSELILQCMEGAP
jgi:hypothetical protein